MRWQVRLRRHVILLLRRNRTLPRELRDRDRGRHAHRVIPRLTLAIVRRGPGSCRLLLQGTRHPTHVERSSPRRAMLLLLVSYAHLRRQRVSGAWMRLLLRFTGRLAGNYGRMGLERAAGGGFVMQKLC